MAELIGIMFAAVILCGLGWVIGWALQFAYGLVRLSRLPADPISVESQAERDERARRRAVAAHKARNAAEHATWDAAWQDLAGDHCPDCNGPANRAHRNAVRTRRSAIF